jgi:hypothetical protein
MYAATDAFLMPLYTRRRTITPDWIVSSSKLRAMVSGQCCRPSKVRVGKYIIVVIDVRQVKVPT